MSSLLMSDVSEAQKWLAHSFTVFKCVLVRVEIIHVSKFLPGTIEKNSSTIGPPAGIEPTPV